MTYFLVQNQNWLHNFMAISSEINIYIYIREIEIEILSENAGEIS